MQNVLGLALHTHACTASSGFSFFTHQIFHSSTNTVIIATVYFSAHSVLISLMFNFLLQATHPSIQMPKINYQMVNRKSSILLQTKRSDDIKQQLLQIFPDESSERVECALLKNDLTIAINYLLDNTNDEDDSGKYCVE
jgi:hypothetical protein